MMQIQQITDGSLPGSTGFNSMMSSISRLPNGARPLSSVLDSILATTKCGFKDQKAEIQDLEISDCSKDETQNTIFPPVKSKNAAADNNSAYDISPAQTTFTPNIPTPLIPEEVTFSAITSPIKGNLNPSCLYKHIKNGRGSPDRLAIDILSEIIYWYRPKGSFQDISNSDSVLTPKFHGDLWNTSYTYLCTKFQATRESIRRAIVNLEKHDLAKRELRHIKAGGSTNYNVLHLHLNVSKVSSILNEYSKPLDGDNKEQKAKLNEKRNNDNKAQGIFSGHPRNEGRSPHFEGHYIEEQIAEELFKERSDLGASAQSLSDFNNFSKEDEDEEEESKTEVSLLAEGIKGGDNAELGLSRAEMKLEEDQKPWKAEREKPEHKIEQKKTKEVINITSNSLSEDWTYKKSLSELTEISKEDARILNKRSGREFTAGYISEIVRRLVKKGLDNRFPSKKSFFNYMTITLTEERSEDPVIKKKNDYVQEVENSRDTSSHMLWKKKIFGRLERDPAYEIVTGTSIDIEALSNEEIRKIKSGDINHARLHAEWGEEEGWKRLIVRVIRPMDLKQESPESSLELRSSEEEKERGLSIPDWIKEILVQTSREIYGKGVMQIRVKKSYSEKILNGKKTIEEVEEIDETTILGRAKNVLRDYFGKETYIAWFRSLTLEEEEGILRVKSPTPFIRDWIKSNYGRVIEEVLKSICNTVKYVEFV